MFFFIFKTQNELSFICLKIKKKEMNGPQYNTGYPTQLWWHIMYNVYILKFNSRGIVLTLQLIRPIEKRRF